MSDFGFSNVVCCAVDQLNIMSFLVNCVRNSVTVLKFWEYDERYLIIPIIQSRLCLSCGAGILRMALVFLGSALIPFYVKMYPTNLISFRLNLNFDRLNLMSFICALSISAIRFSSCLASTSSYMWLHPYTNKLSAMGAIPSSSFIVFMSCI